MARSSLRDEDLVKDSVQGYEMCDHDIDLNVQGFFFFLLTSVRIPV